MGAVLLSGYTLRESGSMDTATHVVEGISDRFCSLARHPQLGRKRDEDLRPGLRSFPADNYVIVYRIERDEVVLILHVIHSSRDIVALLGEGIA
jgi:plasmid stabilization system protein ParE